MKKIKVLAAIALLAAFADFAQTGNRTDIRPHQHAHMVYVCTGKHAKCYHSTPRCKGLETCKGEIVRMTLDEAQQKGKRPCRLCH